MKKLLLVLIILALTTTLSACFKKAGSEIDIEPQIEGVAETGLIIDITDQNNQSATTTPGDILYIKLIGEADSGKQWNITSPTSGDFLTLKDHKIVGLVDAEILNGEFIDEWWFKVEKTGIFSIKFNYNLPNKEPEQSFSFEVISQVSE